MKPAHYIQLFLGALAQTATNYAATDPAHAAQAHMVASVCMSLMLSLGLISGSATLTLPALPGTVVVNNAAPASPAAPKTPEAPK